MNRFGILIASIALGAWMCGGTWFWVCKVKLLCPSEDGGLTTQAISSTPESSRVDATPLTLFKDGKPLWAFKDHIRYAKGDGTPIIPVAIVQELDSLAHLLSSNPDYDLEIIGLYSDQENPRTNGQQLGLARANAFRNMLTSHGLDEKRIISLPKAMSLASLLDQTDSARSALSLNLVKAAVANIAVDSTSSGTGGTDSLTSEASESEPEPQAIIAAPSPRNLYFEFAKDGIPLDDDLRTYLREVISYLNRQDGKKVQLIGHTDDVGKKRKNLNLGRSRAQTVANFFQQLGLEAGKIEVDSKGEDAPIATNKTHAGRQKNRRVEIIIP